MLDARSVVFHSGCSRRIDESDCERQVHVGIDGSLKLIEYIQAVRTRSRTLDQRALDAINFVVTQ